MTDLLTRFREAVARHPDRIALIDGSGQRTSFAGLDARARALAGHLRARGVRPGDRVLLATPVDARLYASLAAIWHCGACAVFPEPATGLRGLLHAARSTAPKVFLTAGFYHLLHLLPALWGLRAASANRSGPRRAPEPLGADEPALISFTSGSSGVPKAIARSHGFLIAQGAAVAPLLASDTPTLDLTGFPVFVLAALSEGRGSVLPDWRISRPQAVTAAQISRLVAATGATRLLLPPAIVDTLSRGTLPAGVTDIFTGGGPVFPDIVQRLRARAPGVRLVMVYGASEAEPIAEIDAVQISPQDWQDMAGGAGLLAGPPVPMIDVRIEEEEILVAGDHVNQGYLDPANDAENKRVIDGRIWHRTGDAGRIDAAGRLWLLGRHGAAVVVRGRKLYPFQVETAARAWPGVRRAALAERAGAPLLVIEPEGTPMTALWAERARALGVDQVTTLARIPMDARHGSKVDRAALLRRLERD